MALNIKDELTDRLAREVSRQTGESLTEAIRVSLEERLRRLSGRRLVHPAGPPNAGRCRLGKGRHSHHHQGQQHDCRVDEAVSHGGAAGAHRGVARRRLAGPDQRRQENALKTH